MIVAQQTHTLIELDTVETLVLRECLEILRQMPESLPSEHARLVMELLAKVPRQGESSV